MPSYLVTQAAGSNASPAVGGARSAIVWAASEAQAKEIIESKYDGDGSAAWSGATATEITNAVDWEGWTVRLVISTDTPKVFSYTSTAANDTMDEIAAQLVLLANADGDIANASYDAATNILTVASAADGLGDKQLNATFTPPDGRSPVASLVGTIVDGGAAGAVLTIVLPADALVPPKFLYSCSVVA